MAGNTEPEGPVMQVIVLGSGGGPNEANTSGLLIRSIAGQWKPKTAFVIDPGVLVGRLEQMFDEGIRRKTTTYPDNPTRATGDTSVRNPAELLTTEFGKLKMELIHMMDDDLVHQRDFLEEVGIHLDHLRDKLKDLRAAHAGDVYEEPLKDFPWDVYDIENDEDITRRAQAYTGYMLREVIQGYLISHPHMDHIAGLVIGSPAIIDETVRKTVVGSKKTIENLLQHIFNDVIMPDLEGRGSKAAFKKKFDEVDFYSHEVCEAFAVCPKRVSHGTCAKEECESSVYFVRHVGRHGDYGFRRDSIPLTRSETEILVFGDVQADSLTKLETEAKEAAKKKKTEENGEVGKEGKEGQKEKVDPDKTDLIEKVWSMAAPKIRMGVLKAIFIECSYDNSRDNEYLYGHLKPNLLMEELRVLAEYVKKTGKGKEEDIKPNTRNDPDVPDVVARASTPELEGALQDLKVVIIHMKERFGEGESIKKLVERELAQLEQHHKLGCKFIISKPGMSLKF